MTGDLPPAALRLMSALPSRTHAWQPRKPAPAPDYVPNGRRVLLDGHIYGSLTEAARRLHMSRHSVRRMIYAGRAEYVR